MRFDPFEGLLTLARAFVPCLALYRLYKRRSFGGIILALQALDAVHLGVDNLNVVRQVGRLLDCVKCSRPAEWMNDGDLMTLERKMIERRCGDAVHITNVMGSADEDMVQVGMVRELDRQENDGADGAADFGRRRVDFLVRTSQCTIHSTFPMWAHRIGSR